MNPFLTWRIRTLDAVVVFWTLVWIVLGLLVARDLEQLTQLSATVATSGRAMRAVVDTITPLASLPVVGSTGSLAARVSRLGPLEPGPHAVTPSATGASST